MTSIEPRKIMLGYVHPGDVSHDFHGSVLQLLANQHHRISLAGEQSGVLISRARNHLVQMFLEDSDAEFFLSVDTDIHFTPEVLDKLLVADKEIISAFYLGKDIRGRTFPVGNVRNKEGVFQRVHPLALKNKSHPPLMVDGVGMGFCLIERHVLMALCAAGLPPLWPFAEIVYDNQPVGEDLAFCLRAKELGFNSWIHPGARVGHRKAVLL